MIVLSLLRTSQKAVAGPSDLRGPGELQVVLLSRGFRVLGAWGLGV